MATWVWLLLGLTALGLVLRLHESLTGLDLTERFGRALAILLILAVIVGLILSFLNAGWQ